jgi:hypothetical protein
MSAPLVDLIEAVQFVELAEQVIERREKFLSVGAVSYVERPCDVPCEAPTLGLHQSCRIEQHVTV